MRKGRVLFCVFLIAVAANAIHSALGWSFKTRLFPLSVSIPLLVLATIQLLQVIFGKGETDEGAGLDLDFSSDVPPEVARRRVINRLYCLRLSHRFSINRSVVHFLLSKVSK